MNQDTKLPGEGFFTWVAAKMGYQNLDPSKWDEFYKEQKDRVFNCDDWAAFLQTAFTSEPKMGMPLNIINLNDLLLTKDYLKGKRTQYYILTVKAFYDTQQKGPFQYHVLVLEQDKLVNQGTVEDIKKSKGFSSYLITIQLLELIILQWCIISQTGLVRTCG